MDSNLVDKELKERFLLFIKKYITLVKENNWEQFIKVVEQTFMGWEASYTYKLLMDANIDISSKIHYIPHSFFLERQDIVNYKIPKHILSIDGAAFQNCTNLKTIYIPKSVASIGFKVFYLCEQLKDIYYDGTYEEFQSIKFCGRFANPTTCNHNQVRLHCGDNYEDEMFFNPTLDDGKDLILPF